MEILINNKVALQRAELGAGESVCLCQKEKREKEKETGTKLISPTYSEMLFPRHLWDSVEND